MSEVQSVLFDKKYYTTQDARKWLADHNFVRMKHVDITKNKLRYRIQDPSYFRRFRIKKITKGIEFVIGFP